MEKRIGVDPDNLPLRRVASWAREAEELFDITKKAKQERMASGGVIAGGKKKVSLRESQPW
eukprot:1004433-Amphidinium_carterae.1